MRRRHELTDGQWDLIKELLPGKEGDAGRTAADNRLFVNAVLFVLRTGIPWADLPERFGKSNSVWRRFDRWATNAVWERVFKALGEESLIEEMKEVHLDSTTVKAHQVASTGRRQELEKKMQPTTDDALGGLAED